MRLMTCVVSAGLSSSALAACKTEKRGPDYECLKQEDAQQVADNFQHLTSEYSDAIANASTTNTYSYWCDSIAELINTGCATPQPLGRPVFDGRKSLIAGQSSQPPTPFQILKMWYSCNDVFVHWEVQPEQLAGSNRVQLVRGVTVIETQRAPAGAPFPWLMDRVFSEFNSGAWLVNLGAFMPASCDGPDGAYEPTVSNDTSAGSQHRAS